MSYNIESKRASSNGWFTPAQTKSYYGKYARTGVTVHWWNSPNKIKDSDHDNIVKLLLGRALRGEAGVANYVLSNKKITNLVHPDNSPWASQGGNATTVSIEFSPHLNTEGYKKGGWLIWQLEKRYKRKLALYKHSQWSPTQCPGTISLKKLRAEADKWASGAYNPKPNPSPPPRPANPKLTWKKLAKPVVYVTNKQPTKLWDFNRVSWDMDEVKRFKKGEQINIYGKCINENLNATYFITEYSFNKRITNGFNQADLDVYIAPPPPTPPPTPPEPKPNPLPEPEPEVPAPDTNAIVAFLTMIRDLITEFLSKFKNKKE